MDRREKVLVSWSYKNLKKKWRKEKNRNEENVYKESERFEVREEGKRLVRPGNTKGENKRRKGGRGITWKVSWFVNKRKESLKKGKESPALICFLGWKEIRVVVSLGLLLLETELLADSWQDLVAQEK